MIDAERLEHVGGIDAERLECVDQSGIVVGTAQVMVVVAAEPCTAQVMVEQENEIPLQRVVEHRHVNPDRHLHYQYSQQPHESMPGTDYPNEIPCVHLPSMEVP